MSRSYWGMIVSVCVSAVGCSKSAPVPAPTRPAAAARAAASGQVTTPEFAPEQPAATVETAAVDPVGDEDSPQSIAGDRHELKLEGITFVVPNVWKKVRPPNQIIEAEFELPPADGGVEPGRLTLMSSGGVPDKVIATRALEFTQEAGQGPLVESLKIGEVDATWVDLRGEWKGPTFSPIEPRPDYRMLLVIIPFTEGSAFYAKLTGPRETIGAREMEFREFVRSAKIAHAKGE